MDKSIQRDQARELFFQTEMTQEQIAHLLNVNRKTVGLWIQQGKWRDMKQAALEAPGMILQSLYHQLYCLNANINSRDEMQRFPTLEESTIQRRLMMSIKSFDRQSAGNYIQTYTELISEIALGDKEMSKEVCHYADDIIKRKYHNDQKTRQQYMFLNDDVDDLTNLDNQNNEEQTPPASAPESNSESPITNSETNATSCDIQNSQITQEQQPSPEISATPTSQNNISANSDNAPQPQNESHEEKEEIKLPHGVTLVNSTTVYDPALGRNREIKIGEVDELLRLGYIKYLR